MAENTTHPVYIDSDRRQDVKKVAVDADITMKELMERFSQHGEQLDLHNIPLDEDPVDYLIREGVIDEIEGINADPSYTVESAGEDEE